MVELTDKQKKLIDESDQLPVTMVTERTDEGIDYSVVAGSVDSGDFGNARNIWYTTVFFGTTDATRAGGAAFVAAAREQQKIADLVFEYIQSKPV
jgi:hypothetical protein